MVGDGSYLEAYIASAQHIAKALERFVGQQLDSARVESIKQAVSDTCREARDSSGVWTLQWSSNPWTALHHEPCAVAVVVDRKAGRIVLAPRPELADEDPDRYDVVWWDAERAHNDALRWGHDRFDTLETPHADD